MVTLEDDELFIVGGKNEKRYRNDFKDEVLKLVCDGSTPNTCTFQEISTKLQNARNDHIALPIIDSFASQLCS